MSTRRGTSGASRAVVVITLAVAVVLVAAGVAGWLIPTLSTPKAITGKDLRGNTVQLDPGAAPNPSASAHADDGGRLIVSSVGLNVALGSMDEADGAIVPPGFTSAYWVRNLGVPLSRARTGTVYVVMHALRGGGLGPGNCVADISHQRSKVRPGASIQVDGVTYLVTGSRLIAKDKIAQSAAVWGPVAGRLVLITCLEHEDGSPSTDNLVITAELATRSPG